MSSSSPTTFQPSPANSPSVQVIAKSNISLFHEAGVYHEPTKALWVISDAVKQNNNITNSYITRLTGLNARSSTNVEYINSTLPGPTSAHHYIQGTPLGDVIMFLAAGNLTDNGGVYALNPYPPYNSTVLVGSYGDYPFNSIDEVAVSPDGVIFFTDPAYGFYEDYRPMPDLPNQAYSFDPATKDLRVVADRLGRPNGLAISPNGNTVYIGDTGAMIGNGTLDTQGSHTIYAYDRGGKFLGNRHVLAMPQAAKSAADGMKTDLYGNVWAAVVGLGVAVWGEQGTLLGCFRRLLRI